LISSVLFISDFPPNIIVYFSYATVGCYIKEDDLLL